MSKGILLHRKHGLNPTVPVCWWCGKDRNEVALLGAAYRDEAPHRMVIDREPCDDCRAQQAKGITMIRCTDKGETWTGQWAVITEDALRRVFTEDVVRGTLKHRRALLDAPAYDALFAGAKAGQ